jgi:signal transduction histidine kinase
MKFNLKLTHKGFILVCVPLLFELAFIAVLYGMFKHAEYERARADHARSMVGESGEILRDLYNAGTAVVAYRLLRNKSYSNRFSENIERVNAHVNNLKRLAGKDRREAELVARIEEGVNKGLVLLTDTKQSVDEGGEEFSMVPHHNVQKEVAASMGDLVSRMRELNAFEEAVGPTSTEAQEKANMAVNYALLAAAIFSILLALSLAVWVNQGTTRRLSLLMDNSMRLASGEPLHAPVGGGDEISHLDKVFHGMAESLDEAARLKQEFVAMITHDLRTPLTSVRGSLSLLLGNAYGKVTDGAIKEIKSAESNVTRVISLINELLDVEKMEAGKMEMDFDTVPAAYILENSLDAVRGFADATGIRLQIPSSDIHIYADGDRLTQVMINLLSNAVKFSPRGSIVIVTVERTPNYVEFKVIDQGPGIPRAYRSKIFERYRQVSSTRVPGQRGTGLGLNICKLIVEQHGGTIGFDTQEGRGSTFWFRIPAESTAKEEKAGDVLVG